MQSHEILQKVIVSTKVIDQEYALWKLLLLFANLNLRVVSVRNCMIYSRVTKMKKKDTFVAGFELETYTLQSCEGAQRKLSSDFYPQPNQPTKQFSRHHDYKS